MSTMTSTPTDQLPPPPKWMLDEVETAERAHLDDLMDRCFTIKTFKDYVLPIYWRHKSATGHIMATAFEDWQKHEQDVHDYTVRHAGRWGRNTQPTHLADWGGLHWFYKSCLRSSWFPPVSMAQLKVSTWTSPCLAKVIAAKKLVEKQAHEFMKTKTGKLPFTRVNRFEKVEMYYHPDRHGNFWKVMETFKKNKFMDYEFLMEH